MPPKGFKGWIFTQTPNSKLIGRGETCNPKGFQVWFKRGLKPPFKSLFKPKLNPFRVSEGRVQTKPETLSGFRERVLTKPGTLSSFGFQKGGFKPNLKTLSGFRRKGVKPNSKPFRISERSFEPNLKPARVSDGRGLNQTRNSFGFQKGVLNQT